MTQNNEVKGLTKPTRHTDVASTKPDRMRLDAFGQVKDNIESEEVASVLETENGKTILHNDVVAKIAGMALREVDGVYTLAPYGPGQVLTRLTHRVSGRQMRDLGVHVDVGKVEAAVDARIIVKYGHSIIDTANEIRSTVTDRIGQMTGLRVVEVNVEVVDLHFPADKPEEPEARVR